MEYFIFPDVFKKEVCGEFSATAVLKELERMGLLRRGTEKNYLMSKESLPGIGWKRVYVVVPSP